MIRCSSSTTMTVFIPSPAVPRFSRYRSSDPTVLLTRSRLANGPANDPSGPRTPPGRAPARTRRDQVVASPRWLWRRPFARLHPQRRLGGRSARTTTTLSTWTQGPRVAARNLTASGREEHPVRPWMPPRGVPDDPKRARRPDHRNTRRRRGDDCITPPDEPCSPRRRWCSTSPTCSS